MNKGFVVFSALVCCLAMLVTPVSAGRRGGRYPMSISKIHGRVEVRLEKPGSRWHTAKRGDLLGGPYLLRTGRHSYAHFGKFRCVDANSLIRINFDSEASLDVLRGQMSAVDGKRGPSLPDNSL